MNAASLSRFLALSALTMTFLIPVFGVFRGFLFFEEAVGWHAIVGSIMVIVGTVLVTGFPPKTLIFKKAVANV